MVIRFTEHTEESALNTASSELKLAAVIDIVSAKQQSSSSGL
jgi:hypothetical protein